MLKHLSIAMAGLLTAASALAAGPVVAPVSPMKWQENKNYFLVEPPQPTASGGKVGFSPPIERRGHRQITANTIRDNMVFFLERIIESF